MLAGKYRLADRIAQGGMGAVWRAEHLQLRRTVAVKLMSPKMLGSDAFRARFEREARAAAQLQTRHVVTIHDYGFDGDEPFIVMELLEGEDLSKRLRRVKKLAPEGAAAIVGQVARALERAHAAGLVHRDLKPANVFLARIDDEEVVKVLDFGIAKAFGQDSEDDVTGDDEVLGTPMYMSPEQIRKTAPIDPRSDLWALSVLAYRMLTGVQPFNGETRGDIVVRVCTAPIVPPSTLDPWFGAAVDAFFERALAKDPAARFESARTLSAALDAALGTSVVAQQRASFFDIQVPPIPAPRSSRPDAVLSPIPAPRSSRPDLLPAPPPPPLPPPPPPSPPSPLLADAFSAPAPEIDTTLSARSTHIQKAQPVAGARSRPLLVGLAIAGVSAAIAVPIGIGVLGGGDDPAASAHAVAAEAGTSAAPALSASAPPATSASTSSIATDAPDAAPAPSSTASAAASAVHTAAPTAAPAAAKPPPNKRRKVVLGL